jgi:hypothetical protein
MNLLAIMPYTSRLKSPGESHATLGTTWGKHRVTLMQNVDALTRLETLVREIGGMHNKLVLLVGAARSGKTKLLREVGNRLQIEPTNVGIELGRRLAATPNNRRGFSVGELLREIAGQSDGEVPLLLDNLEVLFERTLQINPLELVKLMAHSQRVVAAWPGELRGDRLIYADNGHPEHRDYSRDGVVVLEI